MLFFENKEILINGIKYPMDDEGNQYFLFRIGRILGLIKVQSLLFYLADKDVLAVMKKAGLYSAIGEENFCENIDKALKRAEEITEK